MIYVNVQGTTNSDAGRKGIRVKKASEYRKHAGECRALARQMKQGEYREQLLVMADTWERLAAERDAAHSATPKPVAADPAKE
jgi:hypothetical protein